MKAFLNKLAKEKKILAEKYIEPEEETRLDNILSEFLQKKSQRPYKRLKIFEEICKEL